MNDPKNVIPAMIADIVAELDYDIYKEMYEYGDPNQLPRIRRLEEIATNFIQEGFNV